MIYKIKIPNLLMATIDSNNLIFSSRNSKAILKIADTFKIKIKNRSLFLILCSFYKKNIRFLIKTLPAFYTQIIKIKEFIFGLLQEFSSCLFLSGLGFKLEYIKQKRKLIFKLGYSHLLVIVVPKGLHVFQSKETTILIKSGSKEKLHNFAKYLQSLKFPDVYKNKGILIKGDKILKKKFKKK